MATLEVKKRCKNGVLYTNGLIKVENVRFSFPHLDKPYAGKKAKDTDVPKYGIVGMLDKKTHVEVKAMIDGEIASLLKEGKIARMPGKDKFCRDGDDEKEPVYEGHWIVSARETNAPTVRDKKARVVSDAKEIRELIEGGYWGHMLIRPWLQNNDYGQKVNAGLTAVQHIRDDETFGTGRIDDTDAWADESDSDPDGDDGMGGDDNDPL